VAAHLDALWLTHSVEVELVTGKIFADIVLRLNGRRIVIECDGETWHTNDPVHGEDRVAKDRWRDAQIRALGCELVHLPERDIVSGAFKATLAQVLEA